MSGQHHTDRAKKKSGDLRKEVSDRVGLTAREQGICRKEGFDAAARFVRDNSTCKDHIRLAWRLEHESARRWPDA